MAAAQLAVSSADAHRELMWNMGTASHIAMYALMVVAFVLFGLGLRRRIRSWKRGRPEGERFGEWGRRLWILLRETFLQAGTRRSFWPGVFHSLIFYSFIVLFITTLIVMVDMDFGVDIFHGPFYLGVSLAADIAGALLMVGLAIAAFRRWLAKPDFLPAAKTADALVLGLLAFLALTGFLAEGARIRFHPMGDPWQAWTPVGSLCAALLGWMGPEAGKGLHFAVWWLHALGTFAMIALIPHTKFFHMLAIPTNQLLARLAPKGALRREDIEALMEKDEEEFAIGIAETSRLTWKQRLDLDACIECGRCDSECPAWRVGQPLSPRRLVEDLKRLADAGNGNAIQGAEGTVFSDKNFIWHCRTCHGCQTHCPAGIRHVDLFYELRRAEVMLEGRLPADAGKALKTMEAQGNPFGGQAARLDLVEKLGLPVLEEGGETEVLFWVGCANTFDPEKQAIAADMAAILRHAGIPFAHLGADETCCGDPARLLGDENLFQATAKQTLETLRSRRFKHLLVTCPHGYNVFKHEYPQFGGDLPVIHHTEYLARLLREGRLRPSKPLAATAVFHDPCYLGRYQGIFDAPRRVLEAIPGLRLGEMRGHHEHSFCCGAGGGHFWMDLDQGEGRTFNHRVDQAVEAGASVLAVGCSFCWQMLENGVKAKELEARIQVKDVASLVRAAL